MGEGNLGLRRVPDVASVLDAELSWRDVRAARLTACCAVSVLAA